jgi:putative aldouronate transport system permease protein
MVSRKNAMRGVRGDRIKTGHFDKLFLAINTVAITLIALICLYPYLNIVAKSFSSSFSVIAGKVNGIWPVEYTAESYQIIFRGSRFFRSTWNTVFVTVIGTVLNLTFTLFVAYAVTRPVMPGKKLIMILYIITMVFGGGLIPTYLTVINAGMRNSLWALIIPSLVSPFNVILMRNFLNGIPYEITESATIDGTDHFRMLSHIIFPLSLPSIATISIFLAVGYWNSFFDAMIYIDARTKQTLQLYLRDIMTNVMQAELSGFLDELAGSLADDSIRGAAIFCSTLPIICVYPFLQKYFVKGVTLGAVKG